MATNRDEDGRFERTSRATRAGQTVRRSPYASAAILGALFGVAGLFAMKKNSGKNWSEFGGDLTNRASEALGGATSKVKEATSSWTGMRRDGIDPDKSQAEIAQEALTLKETGAGSSGGQSMGARGPVAQQDIKAGIATSNQEAKAGAKALS